ncbi:hypothetical protein RKD18_000209 [Streptomyces phaeoluteigriseus]
MDRTLAFSSKAARVSFRAAPPNVITRGRAVSRDFRQYVAFLRACDIDGRTLGPWFAAWF